MAENKTSGIAEFVSRVIEENGAERSMLAAILHSIQQEYKYLP